MRTGKEWRVSLVCVVLMALLGPAALALDFPTGSDPAGTEYIVSDPLPADDFHFIRNAKVDFVAGSALPDGNWIIPVQDSVVNFIDCAFGVGSILVITVEGDNSDPEKYNADVTLHGSDFKIDGDDAENGTYFLPNSTVTGLNASRDPFSINVQCLEVSAGDEVYYRTYVKLGGDDGPVDVDIDIKPDSEDNVINLGAKGVIPVAILSDDSFDATFVDPDSLFLGGAKVAVRGKSEKWMSHEEDVDGDGDIDLMLQFDVFNSLPDDFQEGPVFLEGTLYDGTPIIGKDRIIVVPQ